MKSRSVSIHPAALDEALAAGAWYAARSRQASKQFWDEIDRLVARVSQHPEQFALFEAGTRRALLRRFRYLIVFRDTSEIVEIIAVAHGKRRPGYWLDRV